MSGELYERMARSLVASWTALAQGAPGAWVRDGVAVFPAGAARAIYNNALLRPGDATTIDAALAAYGGAGIDGFALWVHESDHATRAALRTRGLRHDVSTRAMAMTLDGPPGPRPGIDAQAASLDVVLGVNRLPADLLPGGAPGWRALAATLDGVPAAALMTFDHDGDCHIANVATLPHARRRGLATALTTLALQEAARRGCRTASLQASPMAERLYAAIGFRDLGRFDEYVAGASDRA